jgi:hypothetical protein
MLNSNNINRNIANPNRILHHTEDTQNPNHPNYIADGLGFGHILNGNENFRGIETNGRINQLFPSDYEENDKENFDPNRSPQGFVQTR